MAACGVACIFGSVPSCSTGFFNGGSKRSALVRQFPPAQQTDCLQHCFPGFLDGQHGL